MKGILKKLAIGMVGLMTAINAWAIDVAVAPMGFYIDLDKSNTQEITIENTGLERTRVEISFDRPEDTVEKNYMGDWVKVYPKIVTIGPGESRKVRFSVRRPDNTPEGEYKSLIFFNEKKINVAKKEEEKKSNKNLKDNEVEAKLDLNFILGIEAYGKIGTRKAEGEIHSLKMQKRGNTGILKVDMTAKGNSYPLVYCDIDFLDTNGKKIESREERFHRFPREKRTAFEKSIEKIPQGTKKAKIVLKEKETGKVFYQETVSL